MSTDSLASGAVVLIDGVKKQLLRKVTDSLWQVEDERTKRISEYEEEELWALYAGGKLTFWTGVEPGSLAASARRIFEGGDETEDAKRRRLYAKAVLNLANSRTVLEPAIREVWEKLTANLPKDQRGTPPGWVSVYRWKRSYLNAGQNFLVLVGEHQKKGNRENRYPPEVSAMLQEAIETRYLQPERRTVHDVLEYAQGLVVAENRLRPESARLPLPTRRQLETKIKEIPAYDCYAARHGKLAATKKFRAVLSQYVTQAPLDRAEMDHTRLDLMVVDDETKLPLGRPWLTVCLDSHTRCVLGIYISFEPPSYFTVAQCLKHAFRPKLDIKADFPSIENSWLAFGVMRELTVDNGMEFHSRSLEDACYSLGIELHYTPRRTPWMKGKVERFQGTLNRGVSHLNPGTTFSNIFDKEDYDPSKHAVIRYSKLKELTNKWIVDVYHQMPHRALHQPPAVLWQSSISSEDIRVASDPAWLDAVMGKSVTRRLTHKGIELDGLFYNSSELTLLRRKHGAAFDVQVRVDSSNLGSVVVFSPEGTAMFKVPALAQKYAAGLTEWQHRVFKRYVAAKEGEYSPDAWLRAKMEICRMVQGEFMHKKQATRTKVARFNESRVAAKAAATDVNVEDAASAAPPAAPSQLPTPMPRPAPQGGPPPSTNDLADAGAAAPRVRKVFKPITRDRGRSEFQSGDES